MNQVVMSFSPVASYIEPNVPGPFDCQELGFRWLDWVAEFSSDCIQQFELVLLVRAQTQLPESVKAWGKFSRLPENSFVEQYPLGPNLVFRQVLWFQYHKRIEGPFLWIEPDCVPVKSDWLHLISHAYQSGGKPFMGNVVDSFINQHTRTRVPRHMTGNAVYPDKAYLHAPRLMEAAGTPWDVYAAEQILPKCHLTDLFQHEFRAPEIRTLNEFNTIIKPNTALYHSDKFAAIARLLGRGEEVSLEETFSSVPLMMTDGPKGNKGPSCAVGTVHDLSLDEILEELKVFTRIETNRKKIARFLVEQNIVNQGHVSAYGKKWARGRKKKSPLTDEEFKNRIAPKPDVAVASTNG
jgi:hypothetical protein